MAAETWVALLRGVNIGGRNRVPMAELRRVFEDDGCKDVRTYIASGNVVFARQASDRAALGRRLERAVDDAFGVPAAVVLRTGRELAKVLAAHPFGSDTSKSHVAFLPRKPAASAVRALAALDGAPDELKAVASEVFLRYPNGVGKARLTGAAIERRLGQPLTMRNWRTVERLAELAG